MTYVTCGNQNYQFKFRGFTAAERSHVFAVALGTFFLCFMFLYVSLFLATSKIIFDFSIYLIVVFFLLLSFFHLIAAEARWTETAVRMIDYIYLGTAALGVLLFAENQSQYREQFRVSSAKEQLFKERFIRTLNDIEFFKFIACDDEAVAISSSGVSKEISLKLSLHEI